MGMHQFGTRHFHFSRISKDQEMLNLTAVSQTPDRRPNLLQVARIFLLGLLTNSGVSLAAPSEPKLLNPGVAESAENVGDFVCSETNVERRFDIGNIEVSKSRCYVFSLENRLGVNVDFSKSKTSCGCLAAIADKQVLAPGEEATVALIIKPSDKGMFVRKFKVPVPEVNKTIEVVLAGKSSARYHVNTDEIDLSRSGGSGKFRISSPFVAASGIRSVSSPTDGFTNLKIARQTTDFVDVQYATSLDTSLLESAFTNAILRIEDESGITELPLRITDSSRVHSFPSRVIGSVDSIENVIVFKSFLLGSSQMIERISKADKFNVAISREAIPAVLIPASSVSISDVRDRRLSLSVKVPASALSDPLVGTRQCKIVFSSQDSSLSFEIEALVPHQ